MDNMNLGVIIAQIINFSVLFFILKYFLGDKLVKLIYDRRGELHKLENIEGDVKAKMEEADQEAHKIIEQAREKARELEKSAELIAKKSKEKILDDAEMQAKSILSGAEEEIEKARLSMVHTMKSKIVDLSLKLNEKLFTSATVNKDFMEKELNSINN